MVLSFNRITVVYSLSSIALTFLNKYLCGLTSNTCLLLALQNILAVILTLISPIKRSKFYITKNNITWIFLLSFFFTTNLYLSLKVLRLGSITQYVLGRSSSVILVTLWEIICRNYPSYNKVIGIIFMIFSYTTYQITSWQDASLSILSFLYALSLAITAVAEKAIITGPLISIPTTEVTNYRLFFSTPFSILIAYYEYDWGTLNFEWTLTNIFSIISYQIIIGSVLAGVLSILLCKNYFKLVNNSPRLDVIIIGLTNRTFLSTIGLLYSSERMNIKSWLLILFYFLGLSLYSL